MSFKGVIIKEGESTTGVHYSKDVLLELVDNFNTKYKDVGAVGQISTVYPPVAIIPSYISHTIDRLSYDGENNAVMVEITFLDNDKGNHLVNLFSKVPKDIKVCPILVGEVEDNKATVVDLVRVDFYYNFLTNNQLEG